MSRCHAFFVIVAILVVGICHANESSQSDTLAWRVGADAGFYPMQGHVGVGWYPSNAIRAYIGRPGPMLSLYFCADYYNFKLSEPGGLHEYIEPNAERNDIAIYPAMTLMRFLFLGAGCFYTHSDHVTITSIFGKQPWTGGDIEGFRFFWTVGLMWDIQLAERVSIPIGLYYRNPGYNSETTPLGIRAGISVSFR